VAVHSGFFVTITMPRSHYDTDTYRLPTNFKRIGYDSDNSKYTFRNTEDGSIWESKQAGEEYGEMICVQGPNSARAGHIEEEVFMNQGLHIIIRLIRI
jgi:hypothetical protein